jgi:hypothetical protein
MLIEIEALNYFRKVFPKFWFGTHKNGNQALVLPWYTPKSFSFVDSQFGFTVFEN